VKVEENVLILIRLECDACARRVGERKIRSRVPNGNSFVIPAAGGEDETERSDQSGEPTGRRSS